MALGSHLDSVPGGGWLDGALGVMAALEVLRVAAEDGAERSVALVDFADEEGARFGRSLFGSSAVAGTLDPAALEDLSDADGRPIREVLAEHGVDLDARAARRRACADGLVAYLELHIEQGPVLEREGVPAAAVTGTSRRRAPPPALRGPGRARRHDADGHAPRRRAGGRGDRAGRGGRGAAPRRRGHDRSARSSSRAS